MIKSLGRAALLALAAVLVTALTSARTVQESSLTVGTKISGTRTRSNGAPQGLSGEVVVNANGRLVFRLNDFHEWDFVFERRSKGHFDLADMIKRDPRASDLTQVEWASDHWPGVEVDLLDRELEPLARADFDQGRDE